MAAPDLDLLREYAEQKSEKAFVELVSRHLNLVYSAALRQAQSPQLAEEIVQSVFTDLARNAHRLRSDTILTAWLYQVTRRTALNVIRSESRRRVREQIAVELAEMNAPSSDWTQVEPLLDEAMASLNEADRVAVILRYFENKSLREVGATLGTTEDAAQKRLSRAVERLRNFLARRNVTIGASGLTFLISAHAVQSAPIGLATSLVSAVAVTSLSSVPAITSQAIIMTTLQKAVVTTALAVVLGAGFYQTRQVSHFRAEVQRLEQKHDPLLSEIARLEGALIDARNELALAREENERLRREVAELPKLRGQTAQLLRKSRESADSGGDAFVQEALEWKARERRLRALFDQNTDQRVPEMKLLSDRQWLDIARNHTFDSEDAIRKALSNVRDVAKNNFAPMLKSALEKFVEQNNGNLPDNVSQLKPYFESPIDDAMLQQYEIRHSGKWNDVPRGEWVLADRRVIDAEYDVPWHINPNSYGKVSSLKQEMEKLKPALEAFMAANNGNFPEHPAQLQPYITTAEQEAALRKGIEAKLKIGQ